MTIELAAQIVAEELRYTAPIGPAPIDMTFEFSQAGMDSLEFLFFAGSVERRAGKQIPDSELVKFSTVGDMANWMARE